MHFSFIGQDNVSIDNLEKDLIIIYPEVAARYRFRYTVFSGIQKIVVSKKKRFLK